MPLMPGRSKKAFEKNVKTLVAEGKPQKQALAISYAQQGEKKRPERKLPAASGRPRSK